MAFINIQKKRKPTKTISGVTPLAVVIKPGACPHGKCVYCPSLEVPQSYTPKSPAIMRAVLLNYDPSRQVKSRLKAFEMMEHPTDKIELIIMGGTFTAYPVKYQYNFIKRCYDALNGKTSKSLNEAKKLNERAKHRCVALCIETRPDVCNKKEINRMLDFGATRCELGVQIVDDKIYQKVARGHTVKEVIKATQLLRDSGFKIFYHVMPNLPGSGFKHDVKMFKKLFENENFRPDGLKIYPCQVIKGAELEEWYKKGAYKPYGEKQLLELLVKLKSLVPEYCRIARIMREIPPQYLVAGTKRIDLRKVAQKVMAERGLKCRCTRCREVGFALRRGEKIKKGIRLKKLEYKAANGKEFFLSFVNSDDLIFALCRLRIPEKPFRPELTSKTLIVRELHVFGPQVKLGMNAGKKWQHRGLGRRLMEEAEKTAKRNRCNKIAVISGVGVRAYYRKFGYRLKGAYMVKKI